MNTIDANTYIVYYTLYIIIYNNRIKEDGKNPSQIIKIKDNILLGKTLPIINGNYALIINI